MLVLGTGKVIPDESVVFFDGFLSIICLKDKNDFEERTIDYISLNAEYDEPMSLADIAKYYPNVKMVIYEDFLRGAVYKCGNHKDGEWEQVGTTMGFA